MAEFSVKDIYGEIDRQAAEFGVNPAFAKTLLTAENTDSGSTTSRKAYSGDAVSSAKARGVLQVIPTTAAGLQQAGFLPATWRHDPENLGSQVSAGLAAIKEMNQRQRDPNDLFELATMYNGGNKAWKSYLGGKPVNPETAHYLTKVERAGMDFGLQPTPQQIEAATLARAGQSQQGFPSSVARPGVRRSESSSETTSSKTYDPVAMERFNQSAGLLQNSGGLFESAMGALTDRGAGVAQSGADLMAGILDAGRAAGASAEAQAVLKASGEARRAALLTRANLNPEQTENRMDQALSALDTTSAALDQLKPEIDRRMSVGFFDNPLEYVINMTRLPGMISQYNGLVSTQQAALGKYQAAKEITSSAIDMSQAIDADKTLAVGHAVNQEQLAKAKVESDKTKLALQSKSAADALQAVAVGLQGADLSLKQLMLTAQQNSLKEGESAAEAAAKGEQAALSQFNIMIEAAGGEKIALDRFKQLTPAARTEILNTTSSRRFGGDFVNALRFVEKYGNLDQMAVKGQANVRTWVNATNVAANSEVQKMETDAVAKGKGNTFHPGKAKEEALQIVAAQYEKAANSNMRGASEGNPYKIDYKTAIKDPAFANNSFVQLMAKYGPDGSEPQFQDYDEQNYVRRAVTTARLSGDPALATKKFAADMSSFFQTASKATQLANKPQLFGLSTPQKVYPLMMPAYQVGKDLKSIDLGDPAVAENFMTKQVAADMFEHTIKGNRVAGSIFGLN